MEMRDRLIELLYKVECKGEEGFLNCPERKNGGCRSVNKLEVCQVGAIADHLLANGVIVLDTSVISPQNRPLITHCADMPMNDILDLVRAKREGGLIVPPCKVGDIIYGFHHKNVLPYAVKWFETDDYGDWRLAAIYPPMAPKFYSFTDFGRTAFLTKEEAEAKLKEFGK